MQQRLPGFTLVELIIATALVVTLLAVAIPRYNSYSSGQEFEAALGTLVGCLQRAQGMAAAPPEAAQSSHALSQVELTYDQTGGRTVCTTHLYTKAARFLADGSYDPSSPAGSQTDVSDGSFALNAVPCVGQAQGASSALAELPQVVRIQFGVLEHGIPRMFSADTLATAYQPSFGAGFSTDIVMVPLTDPNPTVSCTNFTLIRTLHVGNQGLPVQII